jgi:hypothetical protein
MIENVPIVLSLSKHSEPLLTNPLELRRAVEGG